MWYYLNFVALLQSPSDFDKFVGFMLIILIIYWPVPLAFICDRRDRKRLPAISDNPDHTKAQAE